MSSQWLNACAHFVFFKYVYPQCLHILTVPWFIFCSAGKMVCTGAKSEQDSRLAARKYAKIIMKLGFKDIRFQDFKIQNIVGSCDVKFPIRLEGLHYKHCLFSSYEPELFPGLIYRMKKPKVVLLIFVSGKVQNISSPSSSMFRVMCSICKI